MSLMNICAGGTSVSIPCFCLSFRYAGVLLDKDIFSGKELVNSRSLQALVAGLKAYSTWENVSCLQDCRECTGGMVRHGEPPRAPRLTIPARPTCYSMCGGGPCGQWALEQSGNPTRPCDPGYMT